MENQNQQPSVEQPVQQSSMQQQAVPLAKSNQSKLFLIIFMLLVTIPGGIYLFSAKNINQPKPISAVPTNIQNSPTPTTDLNREPNGSAATANWKTYINQTGNYLLKIPSSWEIRETNSESLNKNKNPTDDGGRPLNHSVQYYISSTDFYPDPNNSNTIFVGLYVYDNSEKLSINEFVKKYSLKLSNPGPNVTPFQRKSIKIYGQDVEYEALWYPLLDGGVFSKDSYLISKEDKIYEIALFTPPGQELEIKVFDQILSTFKFTP